MGWWPVLIALALGAPASAQPMTASDAAMHLDIVAEMNLARTRPQAYVARLTAYRPTIKGRYAYRSVDGPRGRYTLGTRLAEGVSAVDGAIAFLERQRPIAPLAPDDRLAAAAARLATEQARTGRWGHTSADGSSLTGRIARDGTRHNQNAETIMYGADTARDVVMHLIIDDGVRDRSHRGVIFDPALALVGSACRPHPKWMICVSEYSSNEPMRSRR